MTTRNFRVNNGLEVGDIVISATANTITGGATAAPSADGQFANKKYVDDSIAAVSTTAISQGNSNVTVADSGTGNVTIEVDGTDRITTVAATTTTATGHSLVIGAGSTSAAGQIKFLEGTDNGTNGATLIGPASTADVTVTLPAATDTLVGKATTDTFTNKTFDANGTGNSISNIDFADFASGTVADEDTMSSNSATKLATQQSIKAYVDTEIGNISSTTLTAGNTTAAVSDSGSDGTFTVTCDGNTELTVTDTLATFSGSVTVTGDLTVSGSATYLDVNNLSIEDNLIIVSKNNSGGSDLDAGLMVERGSAGNNAAFYWNEGDDKFKAVLTTSGSDATAITDSSAATIVANIEGNVTGTADVATVATTVTITDNESTDEDNAMVFTAGGDVDGGNLGLESDGTCTYNPSTGKITATGFVGDLTGTADVATGVTVSANNTANEDIFICLVDGATGTQGIETDTGLKYNPSTNVIASTASSAQYADVAERFEADAPMETGSVVMVGGSAEITEINSEMSEDVFGVISDKPAYMMNAGAGDNTTHPFVAMTGRTPVRVIGAVTKGQRLVSSSTKGCARSVAQGESISPFNVIGRALESSTDAGIKLVNCAVRTNN